MEVFLHNLPVDLTEHGLKQQLAPFMRALAIDDYSCDKPKRKRIGNITFLDPSDGRKFLAIHGETRPQNQGRPISNLRLLGTPVFCQLSKREPHEYALKSLAHNSNERHHPTHIVEEQGNSISFTMVRSSCGYTTFLNDEFLYVPEVQWEEPGIVTFKKRSLEVKLENTRLIKIPFNTIIEIVWTSSGSLLVTLSSVPLFFYNNRGEVTLGLDLKAATFASRSVSTRSRISSLGSTHSDFVGQCLVYNFQVIPHNMQTKIEQLKECALTVTQYNFSTMYRGDFQAQLKALKAELAQYTMDNSLPFAILFQLQGLVYNGYLPPATVHALTKRLAGVFKTRKQAGKRHISVNSMKKLFNLIDWPSPFGDPAEFSVDGLLDAVLESEQELHDGIIQADGLSRPSQNLAQVFRIMVTPSRITLHGPEVEPMNRILRRFPNHHEYFIRVQFADENGQDIHFNPRVNNDDVFARFKSIIRKGFQIAGRAYTFLGFSHSSLRSHSAWFSAPFVAFVDDKEELQTYFSIIKAIGSFTNMTCPAKCAARIGQAFSETPFAVNLKDNGISVWRIKDVESEDGSRMFSDGVGTLSWDAVKAIRTVLPMKKGLPTCFQIRMGGVKGMLGVDRNLKGSQVRVRPSMIKFDTKDMPDLEICDVASKPIPLVLNRQVIKILEDMGVSDEWFSKLQGLRINELRQATATTKNTAKFLRGQDVGECIKLYRFFLLLNRLQLNYKEDSFLRAVAEAMVLRELRLLKHKARIPVKKGITLFGIMDETGFLEEKEVYVTYDTMQDRFAPPPGYCRLFVTRSPALHDGDIQYVYNRRPPKGHPLTEHKNCIVFSKKGKRDLPSQLSGGDLDGDLYNVIWDPDAVPTQIFAPADYPRVNPIDIGRPVKREDMAEFFIDFMQSDRLGVIATKHMILADQMEIGTSHSECKKLAELHSTAVDFSKSGVPVKFEDMPMMNRYRPDFLAPGPLAYVHDKQEIKLEPYYIRPNPDDDEDSGPVHKYYRSEKILGKLYRAIDEHKIWSREIHTSAHPNPKAFWKKLIDSLNVRCNAVGASPTWQHHAETARQIRTSYEHAIYDAMTTFSEHPVNPITELEVFIGHILNKTGVQTHRQRERSIKLKDEFDRIASWILTQMRPAGPITGYASEFDNLERCLACVHVAGEPDNWDAGHRRGRLVGLDSFRVVATCALLMEIEVQEKAAQDVDHFDYAPAPVWNHRLRLGGLVLYQGSPHSEAINSRDPFDMRPILQEISEQENRPTSQSNK
ncbi:RNA dependent RNA polymerase-domain-containing protein [Aspergillus pseudoustus]|uniref:RNA-dependent RNA polymerase n=1 Tax=Aspergillus pseudoustus TaxID=1810923 RepID=A0ABR4IMB9_9EURO